MHRIWLGALCCCAGVAVGQTQERSDVPFNAVVYGMFVMPSPEFGRAYDTRSFSQAAAWVKLKNSIQAPSDLQALGAWVTKDATHDPFHIYGEDQQVPGAMFLFSRDMPGPPSRSTNAAALAINIQRPTLTPSQFKRVQEGQRKIAKSGGFNTQIYAGTTLYSRCTQTGGQDYPAFNAQIKLACTAELRKRDVNIIVNTVNLDEQRAIRELIKTLAVVDSR